MIDDLKSALSRNRPGLKESVLLSVLSATVLVAVHFNLVVSRLLRTLSINRQEFEFILEAHTTYFSRLGQAEVVYYIVISLFWSGVGVVAYLVVWAAANVAMELRNLMVYETSYVHKARFYDRLKAVSVRLLLASAVISLVIITIVFGLPLWFTLFTGALFAPLSPSLFGLLLAALFGLAANLYLLLVFIRLFAQANKI